MATKKRAHFGDALNVEKIDKPSTTKTNTSSSKKPSSSQKQTSRAGKKPVAMYLDQEARKQLKMLAVETDQYQEALLIEGLNDLFKKYGKPTIA